MSYIFFVAALPPPTGGQSNINKHILQSLQSQCAVNIIDMSPGRLDRGFKYHTKRIFKLFGGLVEIAKHRSPHSSLYLSVDSGFGLLYNIIIILLARLFRLRIFLHYHSFTFIDRKSIFMSILTNVAGQSARHIFLCEQMFSRFEMNYTIGERVYICSNAQFIDSTNIDINNNSIESEFSVGLLSHLSNEKGLDDFLKFVSRARQQGLPVKGILAGPAVNQVDEQLILEAKNELGDALTVSGPVYGDEKTLFYRRINAFLFPTKFKVEAQPLVLFEALAFGVPIISNARGCISSDMNGNGAHVVMLEDDFVAQALNIVENWISEPGYYQRARYEARNLFDKSVIKAGSSFDLLRKDLLKYSI